MSDAERAGAQARANATWAQTLLETWVELGLREVVASPGARSTPLILAAHADPRLELRLVTDERVAGFLALGLARGSGRPVALVSTSGSAGAHWLPALVEAHASRIGLLALTANRPHELSRCGAPQAVPQGHFFTDQVGLAEALPAPGPDPTPLELRALETLALSAWSVASGDEALPVHLDLAFRAPLWSADAEPASRQPARAEGFATPPAPRAARRAPPRLLAGSRQLSPVALASLAAELSSVSRGLIFCGPDAGGASPAEAARFAPAAAALAEALGWPLLCDAASGLRGDVDAVTAGEAIARAGVPDLAPEAVLRFGGPPVHKTLATLLATAPRQWVVDRAGRALDPTHSAELLVSAGPLDLAQALAPRVTSSTDTSWRDSWRAAETQARAALAPLCEGGPLWSGGVACAAAESLGAEGLLHVASSLAIRDVDAFAPRARVSCSRGANGIDGTLSTAWGLALALGSPLTILCGDLAFLHDLGGLVALRGVDLRVVVVDNRGGGIFGYLPVAEHPDAFEACFLTPPSADLLALARAAGAQVRSTRDGRELRSSLSEPPRGLEVIVAEVERSECEATHAQAWGAVAKALRESPTLAPAGANS